MTEILCKWINETIGISKKIEPSTFAQDFANGYFIGEILHKHGLQDDFDQFSQNKNSNSKLNNFMRLQPTINLLEIPFNTNMAREIMQEKHSTTTQLLYQMYIALTNKEKRNITGMTMETLRPNAPVRLGQFESKIYEKNLKAKTPRQTDLDLQMLRARYDKFKIEQEKIAFEQKFQDEEKQRAEIQDKRSYLLNKSKEYKQQQAELLARIKAAAYTIPKTPPKYKKEAIIERRKLFEKDEGMRALKEIENFEKKFKSKNTDGELSIVDLEETRGYDDANDIQTQLDPEAFLKPKANDDYIAKIRNRLQEDAHARKEREKRRRKVLVDQLKANEALEESKREEALVSHLLRQSQFERRIAVELLHARHEKDIIRENRIVKEREILFKREKEFQDALDKERELARLAKYEYLEQTKKDKEFHDLIAADRAEAKYKKHYELCAEVVNQIFEFACKVAEYRELTDDLIPPKIWRDWLNLFREGKPLYAETVKPPSETSRTGVKEIEKLFNADIVVMDESKLKLLDECDFQEYKEMIGEWESTELSTEKPPTDNKVLGHVIKRLTDICFPVQPGSPKPIFPNFPLKVIVLGKPFTGKSSCLRIVEQMTGMFVLNPEELILEAIEEYKKNPELKLLEEGEIQPHKQSEASQLLPPAIITDSNKEIKVSDSDSDLSDSEADSKGKKTKPFKEVKLVSQPEIKEYRFRIDKKANLMMRQLGEIAFNSLNKGEPVKDEIIVHLIVERIKVIPHDNGFVIDGFPITYNQAKLLEKALSGYDEDNPTPVKLKRESILAPNPKPDPPKPRHKSAIDLVVYLEATNSIVLKRSVGRSYGTISNRLYHQQFKPPPEGSFTGLNKTETIQPVKDPSNDMEQIQHRITMFEDNWKSIKRFYDDYSIVHKLSSEEFDTKNLANKIQNEFDTFVALREKKKHDEAEHKRMVEILIKRKQKEEEQAKMAKKQADEEAAKLKAVLEAQKAAEEVSAQSPPKSPGKSKKASAKPSTKSVSPSKSTGKKSVSPKGDKTKSPVQEDHQQQALPKSDESTQLQPGSDDWVYANEKIDAKLAKILCDHWDLVESSYMSGTKYVFRKIRTEREQIIRYFFNVKLNFKEYLRRPDTKQVYIDQFVKEYNQIADDMREDEEVKAELHQRVEDLNETLWNICDNKKAESEKERETIMNNGWLPDKIGLLINHYITLMQTELDRFQDTARLLKDYYRCMINPVPEDMLKEYPRLPLLDLKNPDDEEKLENKPSDDKHDEKTTDSSSDGKQSPKSPRTRSPKSPTAGNKSKSPSSNKKTQAPVQPNLKKGKSDLEELPKKHKIPLVPRRPGSQDAATTGPNTGATNTKDTKKGAAGIPKDSKSNPKVEKFSPPPPEDLDEKLIYDAHKYAYNFVNMIMSKELESLSAEESLQNELLAAAAAGEDLNTKGNKGVAKGNKSASKSMGTISPSSKSSKGGKPGGKVKESKAEITQIPQSAASHLSDEDKDKLSAKSKINQEYLAAIKKEESSFKTRVDLIRMIANKVIIELKTRAENSYKDMDDWLGNRFVKEINSIKNLCNYIKYAIENKNKIKNELILRQDDFIIDSDVIVLRTPTPPPQPEQAEPQPVENFKIDSLQRMFHQFKLVAPEGLVAIKSFIDIFNDLMLLNYGNDILPDQWSNLSQTQIESLGRMLANGSEFVDWRAWLLSASMPWPYPTQTQLLDQLYAYKKVDRKQDSYISKSAFLQTPLWFRLEKPATPKDATQPRPYDRHANLINFWFDIFSVQVPCPSSANSINSKMKSEEKINYKTMLLYISSVSDPYEGFLRALSVSQEASMPRIEPKIQMKIPSFNTPEYEQLKLLSATTETFESDQLVSLDAIYRVFHHGERQRGDTHRFAQTEDPEDFMSYQRIATIFTEINEEPNPVALFSKLIAHPVLCEMISICTKFRTPDFRTIMTLTTQNQEENETQEIF